MQKLATIGLGLMLALTSVPALAAVRDLRSGLLSDAQRPANFFGSHSATYSHFVTQMSVNTAFQTPSARQDANYCYVPSGFRRLHWKQGVIQAFDRKNLYYALILCGYLFSSTKDAQTAYRIAGGAIQRGLKDGEGTSLTRVRIGDQSVTLGADSQGIGQNYLVAFRRQNAVVSMTYTGPASLAGDQFVRMAMVVNQRLR